MLWFNPWCYSTNYPSNFCCFQKWPLFFYIHFTKNTVFIVYNFKKFLNLFSSNEKNLTFYLSSQSSKSSSQLNGVGYLKFISSFKRIKAISSLKLHIFNSFLVVSNQVYFGLPLSHPKWTLTLEQKKIGHNPIWALTYSEKWMKSLCLHSSICERTKRGRIHMWSSVGEWEER